MRTSVLFILLFGFMASCEELNQNTDQPKAPISVSWTKCWGTTSPDDFSGSVLDGNGNLYFVGASDPDGYQGDIFLSKISLNNQTVQWSRKFDSGDQDLFWSPSGNGHSNGGGGSRCVALDASGNVYIAGSSKDGFFEVFVMKIDPSGNVVWQTNWEANTGGLANGEAKAYALDVSGDKVFVTGSSAAGTQASGSATVFLLTLDQMTGSVQSGTNVGIDASAGYNDIGYTIKSINGDVVYIAGWEGQSNSGILYKFSSAGEVFEWQERIGLGSANRITDIDLDNGGNIYLASDFRGVETFLGVMKLDANGNFIWGKKFQGLPNDRNNVSCVRVLNNSLYVGGRGSFENYDPSQFGDGTVIKMSLDGQMNYVYNYYTEGYKSGERIEGFHMYNGNLIMIGETWPEFTEIAGEWHVPTMNETTFNPSISKVLTTSINTGDGVVSTNTLSSSIVNVALYDPSQGTQGSADIMIHSISE